MPSALIKDEWTSAPTTTVIGGAPNKPSAVSGSAKRLKASNCASHSFSCDWPQLSEKLNDLKKALFGSSSTSTKDKRG